MSHDLFLSHSSKDAAQADLTCAWLERNGIRCWIAPRDISPGETYGAAIIEAIRTARVMILIFSSHCNASPQVKREVERAVSNNVAIVPMRIDEVLPQGDLDYFLSAPQWLDAYDGRFEDHLEKLTRAVRKLLDLPSAAAAEEKPRRGRTLEPRPPPLSSSRLRKSQDGRPVP